MCLCSCGGTYALHGFPGSDRSSAECEGLLTGLKWRCLAPGKQMTVFCWGEVIQHYRLTSHILNLIGTEPGVSSLF